MCRRPLLAARKGGGHVVGGGAALRSMPWQCMWLLCILDFAHSKMLAPLRRETALRLLERLDNSADQLSIDIGGTLAKVVLFQPQSAGETSDDAEPPALELGDALDTFAHEHRPLSVRVPELGGNLHFFVFESRHVSDVIRFVEEHWSRGRGGRTLEARGRQPIALRATGGGAFKYSSQLRAAGLEVDVEDEMRAMVAGLSFLVRRVPGEVFALDMDAGGGWTPMASPAECAELARSCSRTVRWER